MQEAAEAAARKAYLADLQCQVDAKARSRQVAKEAAIAEGRLIKQRMEQEKAEIEVNCWLNRVALTAIQKLPNFEQLIWV